ncbi:MAG TPA: adenosine-specific kinase [Candidatus Deferrimicrobium sp.]|nr:adenosine-specific kinase [Candidatus Deferrimicrobium sp.]
MGVELKVVKIEKDKEDQVIIGQANFSIYTTDNLFRELLTTVPGIKCAIAMNEADPKLVRFTQNDERLGKLAAKNALAIAASHIFVIMMQGAYPINVIPTIRNVPGICTIFVASANPLEAIIAETGLGRAVLGVVDGQAVNSIEDEEKRQARRDLIKKIGYTLG